MAEHIPYLTPNSLAGARIWLSGSVPEAEGITAAQRAALLDFVRAFALCVFERGGYIVHGSHPDFTPTLLEEARRHQEQGGDKKRLILVVSHHFLKGPNPPPVEKWRESATVYETPVVPGEREREESLKLLRQALVSRCDAIVVAGGKWWQAVGGRAGVPLELELAMERGLPCFLLGGLGGAAHTYVKQRPEVLDRLKNGLDRTANEALATKVEVGTLAAEVCAHLERLPLVRGRGDDGSSFRILSLDGGGLKGAFTAAALATWERLTGHRIVEHFDLIAGTSTGGILAIGLGLGLTGQQMLDFYKQRGPTIFPVKGRLGRMYRGLRQLFNPKYSQDILRGQLEAAFNREGRQPCLEDSLCRLVIPVYHAVSGESHILRTPHHPDLTLDAKTKAAQAALATAAAPTYFSAAKVDSMGVESSYFDGGVWANTPALAAIVEAKRYLSVPLERLDVLSVGTTEEPFTAREQTRAGVLGWLRNKKILDLLMKVQQESSWKLARGLVGEPRFLRVNVPTEPGSYKLDSANEIEALAAHGIQKAQETEILTQVRSRFLNGVHAAGWKTRNL